MNGSVKVFFCPVHGYITEKKMVDFDPNKVEFVCGVTVDDVGNETCGETIEFLGVHSYHKFFKDKELNFSESLQLIADTANKLKLSVDDLNIKGVVLGEVIDVETAIANIEIAIERLHINNSEIWNNISSIKKHIINKEIVDSIRQERDEE